MHNLWVSIKMMAFLTILTGVVYPLLLTGAGQVLFNKQANGSLLEKDGKIMASELIGQKFEKPEYFWSRPSAVDYNPLPSGGSNLSPIAAALKTAVDERTLKLKTAHGADKTVPQDLVFASASGLDPHISPEAAEYQVERVALARGQDVTKVRSLVANSTEARQFGFLGEPRVNVVKLNLSLDEISTAVSP